MIPCVFGDCVLPQDLRVYVHLFFNKYNPFCDPWNKLRTTLSPNIDKSLTGAFTNKLDIYLILFL